MPKTLRSRPSTGDLLAGGWLPPNAAADILGITVKQLERRARKQEIKRREVAPGTGLYVYDMSQS